MNTTDRLVDCKEAASYYKISTRHYRRLEAAGEVPAAVYVSPQAPRYSLNAIQEDIRKRAAEREAAA